MKSFKTVFSALILCAIFQFSANAQTKTWVGPIGGSWGIAANWSPQGLPTTQDVLIPSGSIVEVDGITNPANMGNLTVQSGAVINKTTASTMAMTTGVFETGSTFNFFAGQVSSLFGPNGGIVFNGEVNIIGAEIKRFQTGNVTINNVINVEAGVFNFRIEGNTLLISAGAVMTVADGSIVIGGNSAIFRNEGLIQKTAGTGTFTISNINFENNGGTINVDSGSMMLSGGINTLTNGQYNVNSNGFFKVNYTGITRFFGTLTGQLDGPFIVTFFRVSNGTEVFLDFTGNAGVIWEGSAIEGVSGPVNTLINQGLITITNDGDFPHQLGGGVILKNEGAIIFNEDVPSFFINPTARLKNTSLGIITTVDDLTITGDLINTGLIQKLNGTGVTSIWSLIN